MIHLISFAQSIAPALNSLPKPAATSDKITNAINKVLITVGIVAVLMVVIGGVRYAYSRGEPDKVAQAKNTIVYAIVGMTICAFAYAIVNWLAQHLTAGG